MPHDIFISHSSLDNLCVEHYALAFKKAGISFWLDLDHRSIPAGSSYASEIMRGIRSSSVFVLLYSCHVAAKPEDVLNELEAAKKANKTLIPVRMDRTPYTDDFSYYLSRKQWIDISGMDLDTASAEIIQAIRHALSMIQEASISASQVQSSYTGTLFSTTLRDIPTDTGLLGGKSEFDVVLSKVGSNKIAVIKEVRAITGLGLADAKYLVDGAPSFIKAGIGKDEATKIKERLEKTGARIDIR